MEETVVVVPVQAAVAFAPQWEIFALLFVAVMVGLGALAFFVVRSLARRRRVLREGPEAMVVYRIRVPKFKNEEEARGGVSVQGLRERIAVVEAVYAALGGLSPEKGFRSWFYGRHDVVSFEMLGHDGLVKFYVAVMRKHAAFFEQQMHAQFPDAFIEESPDYNIFTPTGTVLGGYLKFKRQNFFPIRTYKDLDADPLNALTNALSKVSAGEGIALQIVARPARKDWRDYGLKIVRNMQKGMSLKMAIQGGPTASWFESKEDFEKRVAKAKDYKLSPAEQKMLESIEQKLSKAALEVNIRIVASSESPDIAKAYMNNALQAFAQYNIYEFGNAFAVEVPKRKLHVVSSFVQRAFDEGRAMTMNTEELASVWHLPLPTTETHNIDWLLSRTAPPPASMPTSGLLLGFSDYRAHKQDIFMNEADRARHMYIIGKTGSGKSEFMKNLIAQDIQAGKGVAVIDPHGDLADGVLELIPKERVDDVIYFNPSDMERPMGLNMLEADSETMRDFAVQEMISVFYMLFPPEMIGPMFEHSMRNFMLTLMADVKNPGTLVEIPRMIADAEFQKRWVEKVKDPVVRSFWEDEQAKTSDYHKSEMMGYLVSKVGRFVENEMMRNIIGQAHSSFNFRKIMDEGKILLVNLSKGKTGEVNASLLGLILVAKLQMAAFTRADIPEEQRRPFYLYIDEFQNFVTPSIATILSEARKYKLNLILSHQYMSQLVKDGKSEVRDAVLGNVGSMMVARVGPDDTEVLGKVFAPTFSAHDLQNPDKFTWNVKMIIGGAEQKPFTMKAYPPIKGSKKVADALKAISRLEYGRDKVEVERDIMERAGIGLKRIPPPPPMSL